MGFSSDKRANKKPPGEPGGFLTKQE
jgi:hypothetical protein